MAITKYDEPQAGVDLGNATVTIDDTALSDYFEGLELERPTELATAPSMVAADFDLSTRMHYANDFGNLWLRQEWDFRRPLKPGASYEASARSVDVYERRDRSVILTETVLKDEAGDVVLSMRHHQSFVLYQSEGHVTLRDPSKKEGARSYALPEGDAFGPLVRTISLEMCGSFFPRRPQLPHRQGSLRRTRLHRRRGRRKNDDVADRRALGPALRRRLEVVRQTAGQVRQHRLAQ